MQNNYIQTAFKGNLVKIREQIFVIYKIVNDFHYLKTGFSFLWSNSFNFL